MVELLTTPDVQFWDSGETDVFDCPLVWVRLADCTSVVSILISEGLARKKTPDYQADWCSRWPLVPVPFFA